ncbi:MAG: exopolyphosphatase [Planctomycetota bacterium]|nr:exopolyphosphatase [Planctomycetota bacterium]
MRLLTRSDFDGLGCAVLLKDKGLIGEIKYVHPKDVQDGKVPVTADDILANVPYVPGCGLWFDHHSSEDERAAFGPFEGACDPTARSAARVIYDYYGGEATFPNPHITELLAAIDKADCAEFTPDDVLNPAGWALISFIMDPRTGLGRYKDYRISNYALMLQLVDCSAHMSADQILRLEDVRQRVDRYFHQDALFRNMLLAHAAVYGDAVVVDLRSLEEIYTGNRFLLYSLFPRQNISLQVIWGLHKQNVVVTCGHSIFNRTSKVDVGSLMLRYGGGGHKRVGTCQVAPEDAPTVLAELLGEIARAAVARAG